MLLSPAQNPSASLLDYRVSQNEDRPCKTESSDLRLDFFLNCLPTNYLNSKQLAPEFDSINPRGRESHPSPPASWSPVEEEIGHRIP